jgi:type II secretory pathway predicted ATPase ExeA
VLDKIQTFYGFTKMPFGRDLAPAQLHRHHGHAETVARLTWAITTRSVAVLTGEVGAGKTVCVRAALASLDPSRYRPIYIPNPGIGTERYLELSRLPGL